MMLITFFLNKREPCDNFHNESTDENQFQNTLHLSNDPCISSNASTLSNPSDVEEIDLTCNEGLVECNEIEILNNNLNLDEKNPNVALLKEIINEL